MICNCVAPTEAKDPNQNRRNNGYFRAPKRPVNSIKIIVAVNQVDNIAVHPGKDAVELVSNNVRACLFQLLDCGGWSALNVKPRRV